MSPEGIQTELDEEMENDICKVWDMSMDEVGAVCGSQTRRVVLGYGGFCPLRAVGTPRVGEHTRV